MTRTISILTTLLLMSLITACVNRGHGLHNFGVVEKGWLYRGAQPDRIGLETLRLLNVGTVIDLTSHQEHHGWEAGKCKDLGIRYVPIPCNGLDRVSQTNLDYFIKFVDDLPMLHPVYVHCVYGSDRTSVVCAYYRLRRGYPMKTVLEEAEEYGLLVPAMKHQIEEMKP